jgi:hypothetical protein
MAGLLDFIQGASNSAASTLSGPVDLINMGLLGLGLPMPANPVGGSQWMREKGLTREPQNRTAGLLGEAAGNILPIVAAAKGPQIAAGLLQMGDNLRAPSPMNAATRNQMGAIVYHGSPHKFDKFDASKIGTGEGAQAYGHGLYFAENPDVARSYATALTDANTGGRVGTNNTSLVARNSGASVQEVLDAKYAELERLKKMAAEGHKYAAGWMKGVEQQIADIRGKANVYKVDLPDSAIARMLDWDKPLSQQPDAVRKVLEREAATSPELARALAKDYKGSVAYIRLGGEFGDMAAPLGQITKANPQGTSRYLSERGIPGVRYLDGGSRSAGAGSSNYVVFPGNEGLLSILGRE